MSINPWGTLVGVRPTKIVHYLWREGYSNQAIKRALTEQYQLSEQKVELLLEVCERELPILTTIKQNPNQVALYISVPFCPSRCTYCSFVSYSLKDSTNLREQYLAALIKELKALGSGLASHKILPSIIYVGGGTPTCLNKAQFTELLTTIQEQFGGKHTREFTVEAGRPETITSEKLNIMKDLGVTRVCVNPQTMQQKTLQKVNRHHTPQQIIETARQVKALGFILNMDVILGLPGETAEDVLHTMQQLVPLKPENITVHALALKRASSMNLEQRAINIPSDAVGKKMYQVAQQMLTQQGYYPYYLYRQRNTINNMENIGYTLPDYSCIYNIMMIDEQMTTIGCGAGSVSKLMKTDLTFNRLANPKDALMYIQRIEEIIEKKMRWIKHA